MVSRRIWGCRAANRLIYTGYLSFCRYSSFIHLVLSPVARPQLPHLRPRQPQSARTGRGREGQVLQGLLRRGGVAAPSVLLGRSAARITAGRFFVSGPFAGVFRCCAGRLFPEWLVSPVSPGVSGEIRSDFSRFSRFSRFPPASRIILFSSAVCYPPPSAVFPLADRPSLSVLSRKNSFSRSETAPETRRCADFAPFYLFYSIIFCNMDLLSARVVTARTDGTGHAEPDVFRRICIMAAGGCDNCSLRRESFYRHTDRFGM